MDVPIDHSNGDPHVLMWEDELLAEVARLVRRQFHHAELGLECGGVDVPVEVWLGRMWLG
jgi:hypothetical protein